jgi:hypothetical protein
MSRVARLRTVLARANESGNRYRRDQGADRITFRDELHEHVAGPLAPLINSIMISLESKLQAGERS